MEPSVWTKQSWEERTLEFDATDALATGDSVSSISGITLWEGTTEKTGTIATVVLAAAGTGYAVNEIITVVQAGGALGTIHITAITGGGSTGPISAYHLEAGGSGYATANGVATTGIGANATFNIVTMISGTPSLVGNKAYPKIVGGENGHSYWMRVRLITANGDKIEDDLRVLVRNIGG